MNAFPTIFELHHGDCVLGMRKMAAESVDAVVTSPPYNLGIQYSKFRDDASRDEYLKWSLSWGAEVCRILKPNGALFLNVGSTPASPLLPHQLAIEFSKLLVLQNTLHWIKSISVETRAGDSVSVGHFKPINSPRFITDCHEYIFHFTKTGNVPVDRLAVGVPYVHKSNIARWGHTGGRDLRCRGNNWFIPYETIMSRAAERPHPATFPVALASMCLRLHGIGTMEGGGVVLDPFVGIGHAALAARECGVGRFIGFDIDEEYVTEAKLRVGSSLEPTPIQAQLLPELAEPSVNEAPCDTAPGNADAMLSLFSTEEINTRKPATKKRGRPRKVDL